MSKQKILTDVTESPFKSCFMIVYIMKMLLFRNPKTIIILYFEVRNDLMAAVHKIIAIVYIFQFPLIN